MNRTKLTGLLRLFRFELSFAAGVCVLLAELLALGRLPSLRQAAAGFMSFFLISASALILNDCFDVETDRINAPERPLPAGLVTKFEAMMLSFFVALLGCCSALMLGFEAFTICCIVWFAGFLYNWRLKKYGLAGNLFVAVLVGMTFIFGGVAAGNLSEPLVWFMGAMVFGVDLGEEIAADALDVEGDRKTGSRSLAVLYSPQIAMRTSASIFIIVVAGSTIPFLSGWLEWWYLPPVVLFDGLVIRSVSRLLNPRIPDRINDIRRIYLGGTGMILVFMVIRLAMTYGYF
ncbi:UbiA family prenyltransferase [Chlorobium phaeobacteroides]|jgi:geranylgeranylglycerol-phosphate geranylgeranyltransferase|uniref:UbiA prenyltransferase n=1 Tax=Chlorobium phaeobacteroides (strain DSM 266 / SMG 266 / 2430) TaxID=290317 RepID=A1BH35_CHLPD|nr:UbiA family prenyltransferase [Chlorobium phaeobacteroides]ABL65712.1 UbiA prenyltransferase [Chlorobium phaeobacteroides DSM 266]MBV5326997.1 UbiA family prenyltransferase [Chlorobium sp.]